MRLTLDAALQDRAEEVLAEVGEEWQPKGATAIVMDPRDGGAPGARQLAAGRRQRRSATRRTTRARTGRSASTYEPGSTFKAFTVAGALEDGKVTPDTTFNLPPTITVADREIGESHDRRLPHARPRARSSSSPRNVGAIMIGQRLGAERFDRWVRRFGFGTPDRHRPARARSAASCSPLEKYSGSSMGNLPIGQGLAVTPMQMATGLRRDRQRRRPAPAARRRARRRPADAQAARASA